MKKILWLGIAFGVSTVLSATRVQAMSLSFVPGSQVLSGVGVAAVDIVITGLEAVAPQQVVSSYDLNVSYNPSVLQATGVSFGSFLGASLQNFDTSNPGVVELAEVSLESDASLALLQPDGFTLATLTFSAVQFGRSALTFVAVPVLGLNVIGLDADVLPVAGGQGAVEVVPEPQTLVLLGTGLVMLAGNWRRKACAASARSRKR